MCRRVEEPFCSPSFGRLTFKDISCPVNSTKFLLYGLWRGYEANWKKLNVIYVTEKPQDCLKIHAFGKLSQEVVLYLPSQLIFDEKMWTVLKKPFWETIQHEFHSAEN